MADKSEKPLDHHNQEAPHVNPTKSGMRTGNPQFDPDLGRHGKSYPGQKRHKPHAPHVELRRK
jgi:hypothetical protein